MTRVLLDTHAFLWFVFDDARLTDRAAAAIADPRREKLLSVVSVWEIVIKAQLGKLGLGRRVDDFLSRHISGRVLTLVPIELPHLVRYADLPLHHRDPFDRLLVAQASVLEVPIVTCDGSFDAYDVELVW